MNKKLNTLGFFLGATLVNIVLVMVIALVLLIPYAFWLAQLLPPSARLLGLVVIIVAALVGSFPIYQALVRWFQSKVDMEKYFDPIVKTSRRR